jgi:hypothetical protein
MAEHYPALEQRLAVVLRDPEEARDIAQEAYLRAFRPGPSSTAPIPEPGSTRSACGWPSMTCAGAAAGCGRCSEPVLWPSGHRPPNLICGAPLVSSIRVSGRR